LEGVTGDPEQKMSEGVPTIDMVAKGRTMTVNEKSRRPEIAAMTATARVAETEAVTAHETARVAEADGINPEMGPVREGEGPRAAIYSTARVAEGETAPARVTRGEAETARAQNHADVTILATGHAAETSRKTEGAIDLRMGRIREGDGTDPTTVRREKAREAKAATAHATARVAVEGIDRTTAARADEAEIDRGHGTDHEERAGPRSWRTLPTSNWSNGSRKLD